MTAAPGSASNFRPGQVASERFERKGLQRGSSGVLHVLLASVVPAEPRKGPVHRASSRRPLAQDGQRQSSNERIAGHERTPCRIGTAAQLFGTSATLSGSDRTGPRFGSLRFGQHGVSPLVRLDLQWYKRLLYIKLSDTCSGTSLPVTVGKHGRFGAFRPSWKRAPWLAALRVLSTASGVFQILFCVTVLLFCFGV